MNSWMPANWIIKMQQTNYQRCTTKTENLNKPLISKRIESAVKKLPTKKSPIGDGFTGEFQQKFREQLTQSKFTNASKKRAGTPPTPSYEAGITLIPKSGKDITRKRKSKDQYPYSSKYQQPKFSNIYKGLYTTSKWHLSWKYKVGSTQKNQSMLYATLLVE